MRIYKKWARIGLFVVGFLALIRPANSFYGSRSGQWPAGTVVYDLLLGSSGTLIDGSTSWDQVAEGALATWNATMDQIQFRIATTPVNDTTFGNGRNSASYSDTAGGTPFGSNTLAITRTRLTNGATSEADVYFNNAKSWNSYRGPLKPAAGGGYLADLRRVALHEFGHALGLAHPDDYGQNVVAIMNATTSDLDNLAADDIAGAQALYGAPVNPVPADIKIRATANPTKKGRVTGAKYYRLNEKVTLRALPNVGRRFYYWTENNQIVSRKATYKFFATQPRKLVAIFK